MAGELEEVVGRTEVGRMREVSKDPCTQLEPRYFCLLVQDQIPASKFWHTLGKYSHPSAGNSYNHLSSKRF